MPNLPFHQQQLEFMIQLVNNRVEALNPFFMFLNFFDTEAFYFILIPVIWLGYSYSWGIRIFYWLSINSLAIHLAKHLFGWPRPSMDLPEIGMLHPSTYGFPSGGAESGVLLGILLIYYFRTKTAWIVGICYALLLSFSRLYLGVHYPIDILGGWILAAIMLVLFISTKEPIDRFLENIGKKKAFLLSLAVPIAMTIAIPYRPVYFVAGAAIGIGIGTYLSLKHRLFLPKPKSLDTAILRSLVGIGLLFLFVYFTPGKLGFIKSLIVGLIVSLVTSPLCKKLIRRS